MPNRKKIGVRSFYGYTLIEVMVSTLVLGLAVAAVATMLRKGKASEDSGEIRRQATLLLQSSLEDTAFGVAKYNTIASPAEAIDTLRLDILKVPCTTSVSAGTETFDTWNSVQVRYKKITSKVRWTFEGIRDSVSMSIRITKAYDP